MQHLIHKRSYVARISVDTEKGVCHEDDAGCGQTGKNVVFIKVTHRLGSYSITALACKD